MTEDLTRKTANGSVPGMPSIEDLLGKVGMAGGWDNLMKTAAADPLAGKLKEDREMLQRDYQAVFDTPSGKRVLEDLFDQTFRRAPVPTVLNDQPATIEKLALYASERNGQNNVVFYLCKQIEAGRTLGLPKKKKRKA